MLCLLLACPATPEPVAPPLPFDDDDATEPAPWVTQDVRLGRVDGEPVPEGNRLAFGALRIECAPGPEPGLDNEDPLAEAVARWVVTLDVRGWASVTDPARLFLWDGTPEPVLGLHLLEWPGRIEMTQSPSGSSSEPFGHDRWVQSVPVFDDAQVASSLGGTTLSCLDEAGSPDLDRHDAMVCALDARDLDTRHCWFCGPDLGEPSSMQGDTVGRIGNPSIPGLPPLTVTAAVQCAYGPAPPARDR